jgi:hypothetical protein
MNCPIQYPWQTPIAISVPARQVFKDGFHTQTAPYNHRLAPQNVRVALDARRKLARRSLGAVAFSHAVQLS